MLAESRVGFFRSGFTVAVLKPAVIRPEVRQELIRVVRNGKVSCEKSSRKEEGIESTVVAYLDVTNVLTSEDRMIRR